ncbi:MAG: transporter, family, putative rane transport protein [Baekduia sp.]|nr:transporter, family, putative rane transport protein [Baekduia sp.]
MLVGVPLSPSPVLGHRTGEPGFRRVALALFCAGVATFALLYAPQPLMPALTRAFDVSPAMSSLSLAVTTAALGLALMPAGWLSDAVGRRPVMVGSVLAASALGLAAAAAPSYPILLGLRALQGIALAGLPAVAMAYLNEEVHAGSVGASVGLYIGGNAIGGMLGRLLAGGLAEAAGWRAAMAGVAALGLTCAVVFVRVLPASRNFAPRSCQPRILAHRVRAHVTEPGLLKLNAIGALLMGTFVAVFNGLGFRLAAPPYHLGQTALAAVFLVYPIGSFASASAGRLADRIGRRAVLPAGVALTAAGLGLTAAHSLALVVIGIAILTAGFFAGHSVASSWVGRRASATAGQASALYLLAYYAGSSLAGPLAGGAWSRAGWPGVMVLAGTLLGAALLVALSLRRTPPLGRAVAVPA